MRRVYFFSGLLLAGMLVAQGADLQSFKPLLSFITMTCLSYIMIEVGLDFSLDKSRIRTYGTDFVVALSAAVLPWIFCALYLATALGTPWKEAWLVGLFAAPTSAGVLFTLLAAGGLSGTWVFQKARVLAIFDDVDTVLLLVPLQILYIGWEGKLFISLALIGLLIAVAYYGLRRFSAPIRKGWLLIYSLLITAVCIGLDALAHIHLAVLLPAFALGCMLRHPAEEEAGDDPASALDQGLKALFMLLVGLSMPQVSLGAMTPGWMLIHVVALTILSNAGKCFALLFYREEVDFKQRLALSVALFPRGEVGAGVLLIALGYGLTGISQTLAGLSLAMNLLLTSVFILIVLRLLKPTRAQA